MSSALRKLAVVQPVLYFLVASSICLGTLTPSIASAGGQGPRDAGDLRFIPVDTPQPKAATKAWSQEQTREAAIEAEAVIRRAASRIQTALRENDEAFFMGFGDRYVRQEWPLFAAQEVAYVFGIQAYDLHNQWVPSYSTCERAGKALGDWYHFYRTNLHNGYGLASLKDSKAAREEEQELWSSLAACKKTL